MIASFRFVAMFSLASFAMVAQKRAPWTVDTPLHRPAPLLAGSLQTMNGIAFTRDGKFLYTSAVVNEQDATGRRRARIFGRRWQGRRYSEPAPASFSSSYTDYQPVFSPDGRRLFFMSTRPAPGAATEGLQDLWYVDRVRDGWSEPKHLSEINTSAREGYPAILRDGTLFFTSDRPGGTGGQDIYRSRFRRGHYSPPQHVTELNSPANENDVWVDPDGRYLFLNRYFAATNEIRMYVAFWNRTAWTEPRIVELKPGLANTPPQWPLTPTVTPDGLYFLFTLGGVIQQVDRAALLFTDDPVAGRRRR